MTEPNPTNRLVRFTGSTLLGVLLLAGIIVLLSVFSIVKQLKPELLQVVTGRPADRIYTHWSLLALTGLLLLNLIVATASRVPMRWPYLGAWMAHLGVLVLAVGTWAYAVRSVQGECVAVRNDAGGWAQIDYVYQRDTYALYAGKAEPDVQKALPELGWQGGVQELDIPLEYDGLDIRVRGFLRRAEVTEQWKDDSPSDVQALILEVVDDGEPRQIILSPFFDEDTLRFATSQYIVQYYPAVTREAFDRVAATQPSSQMPHDMLFLLAGKGIPLTAVLARPDGSRWQAPLAAGQKIDVPFTHGEAPIRLVQAMGHARQVFEALPARRDDPDAVPAIRVSVAKGAFAQEFWLPLNGYPDPEPLHREDIGGGEYVSLSFARSAVPLSEPIRVTDTKYEAFGSSGVAKDYICQVLVGQAKSARSETISLNHPLQVGAFQISQGTWLPSGEHPQMLIFNAASRPGLYIVWAGMILICLGLPLAFYLKPLLLRRKMRKEGAPAGVISKQ